MNNPFDYTPSPDCEEAFRILTSRLETLKGSGRQEDIIFCRELEQGKMLGVLIAVDDDGVSHALYAFSGQLGAGGFNYPGFVGPVFDYLEPDGYFKRKEREISLFNKEIADFEKDELAEAEKEYLRVKESLEVELSAFREKCRQAKGERDDIRKAGEVSEELAKVMVRQSQFEKAELRRIKKRIETSLAPFAERLEKAKKRLADMKEKRRADSEALQQWLFCNFKVVNARGKWKSLSEIFAQTALKVPPSGAGECCAPKLLQAAYLRGLHPVAMAEYWYGKPKGGEVRRHGDYYQACRGKCLPVLSWMLQGLDVEPPLATEFAAAVTPLPEILFENEWFCVIDKPSGMLSVPGKGEALSVQRWLEEKYGEQRRVKVAHRLDQDTSGLLIATFGEIPFNVMQRCFATRKVKKTYVADLEGDYTELGHSLKGRIELPLSSDYLDRPRQRIDYERGKEAQTDYEFKGVKEGRSRILFYPHTGRTHQLRVHAAASEGLAMPIVGDRLYGKRDSSPTARLHLHAHRIEFVFPIDRQTYRFESPIPF